MSEFLEIEAVYEPRELTTEERAMLRPELVADVNLSSFKVHYSFRAPCDGRVRKPGTQDLIFKTGDTLNLAIDTVRPPETARLLSEWHEDHGPVTWWKLPVDEPAWIGSPLDSDWPGYHTHWTPHPTVPLNANGQEKPSGG